MRTLVTGGAGFVGGHFVRGLLAADPGAELCVLDKLTYAGDPAAIQLLRRDPRFRFVHGDVTDGALMRAVLGELQPDLVVHFAAESHVDRSIDAPAPFIATNIVGTFELLEALRAHAASGGGPLRLLHVSTDEVYGALRPDDAPFTEASPRVPRSPYAASKAASDHLVAAYAHTYGVQAITTSCCNNYGPAQVPEKLIPRAIERALAGEEIPIYGEGAQIRDWIHVTDHAAALRCVAARGEVGETYLIGARCERSNLEIVVALCELLDELAPDGAPHRRRVRFVADRAGHDFRYAVDPSRLESELGWRPRVELAAGLRETVAWYLANRAWTESMRHRAAVR